MNPRRFQCLANKNTPTAITSVAVVCSRCYIVDKSNQSSTRVTKASKRRRLSAIQDSQGRLPLPPVT